MRVKSGTKYRHEGLVAAIAMAPPLGPRVIASS